VESELFGWRHFNAILAEDNLSESRDLKERTAKRDSSLRGPTLSQERKRKKKLACLVQNDELVGAWNGCNLCAPVVRSRENALVPGFVNNASYTCTGRRAHATKGTGLKTGHYKKTSKAPASEGGRYGEKERRRSREAEAA
jgi:hypothetical protein